MSGRRMLLLAPAELTRDARARRAASAARSRGFEVVGLSGRGRSPAPLPGVEMHRIGRDRPGRAPRFGLDETRREHPLVRELRGLFRLGRLALTTALLWRAGRRLGSFEIVHANDLDTLPAAWLLSGSAARLVYDAHELYSLVESDPPRIQSLAVKALERALARRAHSVVTVSEPIATELEQMFSLQDRPIVVLNCPPTVALQEPAEHEADQPLRAIYQAAVGPNRPLGDLLEAARLTDRATIALRVVGADRELLEREIATSRLESRVRVLDPVQPDLLVEALAEFEVGIVIDRAETRNTHLALPNKLFEYMMAGLAVAAPRLPGMSPIVEQVGVLYEPGDAHSLADSLAKLATDPGRLAELRRRAYALAREQYNAEVQSEGYLRAWGVSE